ncbi:hypothetical protein ACQP2U_24460 [Nocardia sp. CA-084685]|uniref:hypothetical protein n=1 Tax=Nocardia sp. CA-084685 TaxID=3239970 RepID=UPI003D98C9BF
MAKLKIGDLLPTRDHAVLGDHELGRLVVQSRRAEELGLDSVCAGDSLVPRPRVDLLLAAAAPTTRGSK